MTTLTNQQITEKITTSLKTILFERLPSFNEYRNLGGKTGKMFFYLDNNNQEKIGFCGTNYIVALSSYVENLIVDALNPVNTTTNDLQNQINAINDILNADDINLDTVQEIINFIKNTQSELSNILVNNLTDGGTTKALTAEQGKTLKNLYDTLDISVSTISNQVTNIQNDIVTINNTIDSIISGFNALDMDTVPVQI